MQPETRDHANYTMLCGEKVYLLTGMQNGSIASTVNMKDAVKALKCDVIYHIDNIYNWNKIHLTRTPLGYPAERAALKGSGGKYYPPLPVISPTKRRRETGQAAI